MLALLGATWLVLAVVVGGCVRGCRDRCRRARMLRDVCDGVVGPRAADDVRMALRALEDARLGRLERIDAAWMLTFWSTLPGADGYRLRAVIWEGIDVVLESAFDNDRMVAMQCVWIAATLAPLVPDASSELPSTLLERGIMVVLHESAHAIDADRQRLALMLMALLLGTQTPQAADAAAVDVDAVLDAVGHALRKADDDDDERTHVCLSLLEDIASKSIGCALRLLAHRDALAYLLCDGLLGPDPTVASACARVLVALAAWRETHETTRALVDADIFAQLRRLFERTDWSSEARRSAVRLMANLVADGEHVPAWLDAGLETHLPTPNAAWLATARLPDDLATSNLKTDCIVCASNALCGAITITERDAMVHAGLLRTVALGMAYAPESDVRALAIEALTHVCGIE